MRILSKTLSKVMDFIVEIVIPILGIVLAAFLIIMLTFLVLTYVKSETVPYRDPFVECKIKAAQYKIHYEYSDIKGCVLKDV